MTPVVARKSTPAPVPLITTPVTKRTASPVVAKKSSPIVAKKSTPVVARKSLPPPRVDSPITPATTPTGKKKKERKSVGKASSIETPTSRKPGVGTPGKRGRKRKSEALAPSGEAASGAGNDSGVDSGKGSGEDDNGSTSSPQTSPKQQKRTPKSTKLKSPTKRKITSAAGKSPVTKKPSKPASSIEVAPQGTEVNGKREAELDEAEEEEDDFDGPDEEENGVPRLGSLVWGRMKGFPFWPCFVTKCPATGKFSREGVTPGKSAKATTNFHVQFFNWNNETGWVGKVLPWCTMQAFEEQAKEATKKLPAKSSEYKGWHPVGARMQQKWRLAYEEAEKTSGLSRKSRHNLLNPTPLKTHKKISTPSRVKSIASQIGQKRKKAETDENEATKEANGESKLTEASAVPTVAPPVAKKARLDRAGPLCSKSAAQKLAQQRKSDIVASIRRREEEENMKVPPGWEAVWKDGSAETGMCNSEPGYFSKL